MYFKQLVKEDLGCASYLIGDISAAVCANGQRSTIASALLQRHGFSEVANVVGGMDAWNKYGKMYCTLDDGCTSRRKLC